MRKLIVLTGLLAAAGCKQQESTDVTNAQARAAGDALGNGVEDSAAMYGPMTTGTAADTTCVTLSGDPTDADGDAIPVSATLTYDCTATALSYTGTLTGTQMITDDQPAVLAWSFTGTADMHAALTASGGASLTSDWSGDLVGSQTGAFGPFVTQRTLDVLTQFHGGGDLGPGASMVTENNDWTVTFTPQASWTPGGVVVTGSLDASGSWNVDVDGHTLDATLATPTALTIDPACETLVTGGVVVGTYPTLAGADASITVTWTGCGQRTVTHG